MHATFKILRQTSQTCRFAVVSVSTAESTTADDDQGLLHIWLRFEHCPAVMLHGVGDLLAIAIAEPYAAYDMGGHGRVSVGPARSNDLLATMVGSRLLDGAVITAAGAPEDSSGLLLRFENGDIVLGSLCDEWVISADGSPAALPSLWRLGTLAANIDT